MPLQLCGCRASFQGGARWLSVDAKRRAKLEAKLQEMQRVRNTTGETPTVKAAAQRVRKAGGGQWFRSDIKRLGLHAWLSRVWHGNRARGGGLRQALVAGLQTLGSLLVTAGPVVYFFYDDGKSTVMTRIATVRQLEGCSEARVLDVGTGNGVLSRMLAREVEPLGGTLYSIDKDTDAVKQAWFQSKREKISNATYEARDVLDLPGLGKTFTHAVVAMCLHELDPIRRLSVLESVSSMVQGGKIIVLDFSPQARGVASLSQLRNTMFEYTSGHYSNFVSWIESGGLPALVEAVNAEGEKGTLPTPPLSVSKVEFEDRDTHAVYVIDVGHCPSSDTQSKKKFWLW